MTNTHSIALIVRIAIQGTADCGRPSRIRTWFLSKRGQPTPQPIVVQRDQTLGK